MHRILLIEDDPGIRESLVSLLEISDYIVTQASNGEEGLKALLKSKPDLIISDVMMPVMDGFDFLKAVRKNKSTELIPVIMLTAKVDIDSRLNGLELGADDYISKPFEFSVLQLKIHNLIERQRKLISQSKSEKEKIQSIDKTFLKRLNLILDQRMENASLTVEEIASSLNMSSSTFTRKLRKIKQTTPNVYIRKYRLNRAKALLKMNYGNVSQVASKTGFRSVSYFSSAFRQEFSISPKDYQSGSH